MAKLNKKNRVKKPKSEDGRSVVRIPRDTENERWATVSEAPDYYVSTRGRIKHGRRELKGRIDKDGYIIVTINSKQRRLHRLVAIEFIPNDDPTTYTVVDHIDGNKTNNNVENLRWVTVSENTKAAYDLGLITRKETELVIAIDENECGYIYETQAEAARQLNISAPRINKVIRGIEKQCCGYRFVSLSGLIDRRK